MSSLGTAGRWLLLFLTSGFSGKAEKSNFLVSLEKKKAGKRREFIPCFLNVIKDEQYHQELKHSSNFDKKQRSKTNFLSIKLYIWLPHARSHFQNKYSKKVAKLYIKMMFKIW